MDTTVDLSGPVFNGQAQALAAIATHAAREELAEEGKDKAAEAFNGVIRVNRHIFTSMFTSTDVPRTYSTTGTWTRDIDSGPNKGGRQSVTRTYTMPVTLTPPDIVVTNELATYGPWLEGTGSRNDTTRFHGYHGMRMAAQALDADSIAITDRAIKPYVEEMNML